MNIASFRIQNQSAYQGAPKNPFFHTTATNTASADKHTLFQVNTGTAKSGAKKMASASASEPEKKQTMTAAEAAAVYDPEPQENTKQTELLRNIDKKQEMKKDANGKVVFSGASEYKTNGYLDLNKTTAKSSKTNAQKKKLHYSYKDVSAQIQRAKTSSSAGQAVLKAKRKVLELKRKLGSSDMDAEEVQAALNHAKAVERVARKKKRNLEMEEMVAVTQNRDERMDALKEGASGIREDMLSLAQDKISDAQSEIDRQQTEALAEEREDMLSGGAYEDALSAGADSLSFEEFVRTVAPDTYAAVSGSADFDYEDAMTDASAFSDDMLSALDDFADEIGSEEQEMLEETMEQLQNMEIVDPHMSEEDLKELKIKHRNKERKDLVKADMEYLKAMFDKYQRESKSGISGIGKGASSGGVSFGGSAGGGSSAPAVSVSAVSAAPAAAVAAAPVAAPSVDVAV